MVLLWHCYEYAYLERTFLRVYSLKLHQGFIKEVIVIGAYFLHLFAMSFIECSVVNELDLYVFLNKKSF